ncbi:ROK family protein [Candidatus Woesearchaeota archaeon]|nr:ROK family protein [Candidatus Woesearchaeota archaeon]
MKPRILSLDLGGTAVKARVYFGEQIEKETLWHHDYRDCGLEKAKTDLLNKIKSFSKEKMEAIGLSMAGLIATDGSLYRSTVLTSLEKFNLPIFFQKELDAKIVTIDNDADCGAFSEKTFFKPGENGFLYVVVGFGVGSAYVDSAGNLPYQTRFNPGRPFSEQDNPIPNDLGLRIALPKSEIYHQLLRYGAEKEGLEKVIRSRENIKIGKIASATGMKTLLEMLFSGRLEMLEEWYHDKISQFQKENPHQKNELDPNFNERSIAKSLSRFAESGDYYARAAFELLGYFLGYGIAETEKIIREEGHLDGFPEICLSGLIMNSFSCFKKELQKSLLQKRVACPPRLSHDLAGSNLHGAYLRAKEALELTL